MLTELTKQVLEIALEAELNASSEPE